MSRGTSSSLRCCTVWLAITSLGTLCWSRAVGPIEEVLERGAYSSFADLLVAVSAGALVVATGWLWVVATVTVAALMGGRTPQAARGGLARRLVLLLCGAALAASVAGPASAAGNDGGSLLDGLALPDRASAPGTTRVATPQPAEQPEVSRSAATAATAAPAPTAAGGRAAPAVATPREPKARHVVEEGDSLWAIAEAHAPADADLDREWRRIWERNRAVIGSDPSLILPGQALDLPAADTDRDQESPR